MTDYAPPGYIAEPYAPRSARPPLTARAKRGALLGGGLGFTLLTLGYALVAIPVAIGLLVAFFAAIIGFARGRFSDGASSSGGFGVSRVDFAPWFGLLVASVVVGIVLMIVAILFSGLVLRRRDVRHPWGVTFAGAGIAIVAVWIVEGFLGAIVSGMSSALFDGRSLGAGSPGAGLIAGIIVSGVVALAINAAIGWLSWWWMAHAMRPAATEPTAPEAAAIGDRA
jgi:hypothetical protein